MDPLTTDLRNMNALAKVSLFWRLHQSFVHEIIVRTDSDLHFAIWISLKRVLFTCWQKLRSRRIERGALTLASAEVKFQIDTETHDPLDIGMLF
jgi:hypothetical protein